MKALGACLAVLALTTGGCGARSWSFDVDDADAASDSASADDADNTVDGGGEGQSVRDAATDTGAAREPDAAADSGLVAEAAPGCSSDGDCPADAPLCNPSGACIRCSSDLDCANVLESPVCNVATGGCVQCLSRSNCSNPMLSSCDPATERCVGCLDNDDCGPESFCQTASRTCAPMI